MQDIQKEGRYVIAMMLQTKVMMLKVLLKFQMWGYMTLIKFDGPVGGQTRPRRTPGDGSFMMKNTSSVLLKTSVVLLWMMMMRTNPLLMPKTRSVLVCPMVTVTNPVMMKASGDDDDQPHDVEDKFAADVPYDDMMEMNMRDAMTQHRLKMIIGLEMRTLLYKPLQLLEMKESFYSGEEKGELLVKVQDNFVYREEDTMGDVRETYMMAVTCPTGGHHNILRYAGMIEERADKAPAVHGDDVPEGQHAVLDLGHQDGRVGRDKHEVATHGREGHGEDVVPDRGGRGNDAVPDQDGEGAAHVQVPVDEGGGAVPVPVDERDDMAKEVDEGGGTAQVPVDGGSCRGAE